MVTYYIKFILRAAEILESLNRLTRKDTPFLSTEKCEKSFNQIRSVLLSKNFLVRYDPNLPIKFIVDTSVIAVGAFLPHTFPNNMDRPIAYASHLLSISVKAYPQIEREGLAIIFGITKFNDYLYGNKFTIITDNKPLATILGPKIGIPTIAAYKLLGHLSYQPIVMMLSVSHLIIIQRIIYPEFPPHTKLKKQVLQLII